MISVHFTGPERNTIMTSSISKQQMEASKSEVSEGPNAPRTHHRTQKQNELSVKDQEKKKKIKTPQITITNESISNKTQFT